jgi:geranylgeranyl diphosphate synthase type II
MNLEKKITELKSLIEKNIHQIAGKYEPESLYEPIEYIISGGGKRLRPILLILSSEAVGGKKENALNAAVGIELLHDFTLVHDDIMDHDSMRRGRPTVHTKWDEGIAILTGDSLIALAYRSILRTKHKQIAEISSIFTEGMLEICEGQAMDKDFEQRNSISINDYLQMIEKKTAKLLSISAEIGAIIGGATKKQKNLLKNFGKKLGRAFQVQDDLLDIISNEKVLGKDIGSDLAEGKKTFPIVYAMENTTPTDKKYLKQILSQHKIDKKTLEQTKNILKRSGTINAVQKFVEKEIKSAIKCLDEIPDNISKEHLKNLAFLVLNRKS